MLELEASVVLSDSSSHEILAAELWSKHHQLSDIQVPPNSPFAITVDFIMTMLDQKFSEYPDLKPQIGGISHRLKSGSIGSVRRVELEVLQAGKVGTSYDSRSNDAN